MSVSCSRCQGRQVILKVGAEYLEADLCECVQERTKEPQLPEEVRSRFSAWKFQMEVPPTSGGRKHSTHALVFSPEEAAMFQKHLLECERISGLNQEIGKAREIAVARAERLRQAFIPARFGALVDGIEIPEQGLDWLKRIGEGKRDSLALFGSPGTGKTTIAAAILTRAVLDDGLSGLFLSIDHILELRRKAMTVSFGSKDKEKCQKYWDRTREAIDAADIVLIDDIGRKNPTDALKDAYTEVVEIRYPKGKPTIYTTNHWEDKVSSLDGRTLERQIGARAADRIRESILINLGEKSRRKNLVKSEVERPAQEVVPPEVIEKFEIRNVKHGHTTYMSWVAQNPIFQVVSDQERRKLTDEDGSDLDFPKRALRALNSGDSITVWGPILGMEDQLLYLALIGILQGRQRSGLLGTRIKTNFSEIKETLGITGTGASQTQKILRGLRRLSRATVEFNSHDKKSWMGGFINELLHDGKNKHHQLNISLNPSMIKFYEDGLFFNINLTKLRRMNDWGKVFHLFVESLSAERVSFSLEQFAKLAGKDKFDKKQLTKNAKSVLEEQKILGYQSPEAKVEKGFIHSVRTRPLGLS